MKSVLLRTSAIGCFLLCASMQSGRSSLSDSAVIILETVQIGDQVWMKNNLSVPSPNSFWYDNDSLKNSGKGRLYYYSAASFMCPKGWHLPSLEEWMTMMRHLNLDSMTAYPALVKGGTSGLDLIPAGYKSANSKSDLFGLMDQWGFYWTSTVKGEQTAYAFWLDSKQKKFISNFYRRANGFSVRYLKD